MNVSNIECLTEASCTVKIQVEIALGTTACAHRRASMRAKAASFPTERLDPLQHHDASTGSEVADQTRVPMSPQVLSDNLLITQAHHTAF